MNDPQGWIITQHHLTGQWWAIKRDCGASEPLGPFETRELAEKRRIRREKRAAK